MLHADMLRTVQIRNDRVLRVARTIADLDGAEHIGVEHLSEAIQYRNTDILKG